MDSPKKRKFVINCVCEDDEFVKFLSFERDITNKGTEYEEIYVNISGAYIFDWKNKLKAIWSIIRHGEYENFGILMEPKEIRGLIDYLEELLEYWKEERKKLEINKSTSSTIDKPIKIINEEK